MVLNMDVLSEEDCVVFDVFDLGIVILLFVELGFV